MYIYSILYEKCILQYTHTYKVNCIKESYKYIILYNLTQILLHLYEV